MAVKNLGFVKAIHSGTTPPSNTKMLWWDDNVGVKAHKYYRASSDTWELLAPIVNGNNIAIQSGGWDATNNSPDLSGSITTGYAYEVTIAGDTDLGGITSWMVGDLAVKTTSGWLRLKGGQEEEEEVEYTPSGFTDFEVEFTSGSDLPEDGNYEQGASVTTDSAAWATYNDSLGDPPSNIRILGSGFSDAVRESSPADSDIPYTYSSEVESTKTWVIDADDANGDPVTKEFSINIYHRLLFGASDILITSSALLASVASDIEANQQSLLQSGVNKEFTCNADNDNQDKYTYIIMHNSFSLDNIIMDDGISVMQAFELISGFSYTNSYGSTVNANVYRSKSEGAFSANTKLRLIQS